MRVYPAARARGAFAERWQGSSTLAVALSKICPERTLAFTVGMTDQRYDEGNDAATVCKALGIEHFKHVASDQELASGVKDFTAAQDQPVGDCGAALLPRHEGIARGLRRHPRRQRQRLLLRLQHRLETHAAPAAPAHPARDARPVVEDAARGHVAHHQPHAAAGRHVAQARRRSVLRLEGDRRPSLEASSAGT